jgi:hypothetical protein
VRLEQGGATAGHGGRRELTNLSAGTPGRREQQEIDFCDPVSA